MTDFAARVSRWRSRPPDVTSADGPVQAAGLVSPFLLAGNALIEALPEKPLRNAQEAEWAETIHRTCRAVRLQFVSAHADWLYTAAGRTEIQRPLSELAFFVAALVPGLVPTRAQLARERTRIQLDKEGWEVDQAILFHGLLRSPGAGRQLLEDARRPTEKALALQELFTRTGTITLSSVHVERKGAAIHLTLQNGASLNAEDEAFVQAMETAVDLTLLDDRVRVGVVRGGVMTHRRHAQRRVFCAGINLKHLHQGQISFTDFLLGRELGFLSKIARGLVAEDGDAIARPLEKPWIAVVDSFAIGGGAQMLLVMDRVLAVTGSYFSLPAAREGIVPGAANLRLSRLTGARLARQILLADRTITTSDPEAALLFDEIQPDDALDAALAANIERMQSPAVAANRRMLWLAEEPLDTFRLYMADFALEQALRLYSTDVAAKEWKPSEAVALGASK